MFNALEEAKKILERFKIFDYSNTTEETALETYKLLKICEMLVDLDKGINDFSKGYEELQDYNRLLRKENNELKERGV